jgi:chromosome partitioning protein
MKVMATHIGKGGDGKTTLTKHLAQGLAEAGKRVLLIDADVQAHATWSFGHNAEDCLYRLMVKGDSWRDVIRTPDPTKYPELYQDRRGSLQAMLYLVPGNRETAVITLLLHDDKLLRRRLAELEGIFDYVLFDTSPEAGLFVGSILMAATHVLVPCQPTPLSVQSLIRTMTALQEAPHLTVLGIQPTLFDGRTVEHASRLEDMQQRYGDLVWTPITERKAWATASGQRAVVWKARPTSPAAREARAFVQRALAAFGETSSVEAEAEGVRDAAEV